LVRFENPNAAALLRNFSMAPVISLNDLRFLLSRTRGEFLPEEFGGTLPFGPTGTRDVQGVGNNTANPVAPGFWFGAADTLFRRLSFNRLTTSQTKNDVISAPFANSARGTNFTIGNTARVLPNGMALPAGDTRGTVTDSLNPRTISNLIADVSNPIGFQALDPSDPNYAIKQELLEQDNPVGRIGPADGGINPLPYSNWASQFGQFFDHGLDFVAKGVDGAVDITLLPSDSLYNRATRNGLNPAGATITGSRNNTANVTIGAGSSDALLTKLGLAVNNAASTISWSPLTTQTSDSKPAGSYYAYEGTLVLNNKILEIYAADAQDLISQINSWSATTGVLASLTPGTGTGVYNLTLTPARAESFNQISPFVDMSQNYGSDRSRTLYMREYMSETDWRNALGNPGLQASLTDLTTGRLVNAGVAINGEANGGVADWALIKANAAKLGLTLNDKDVNDAPLVAFDNQGQAILDAEGMPQLVALNTITGAQVYVKNSNLAADPTIQNLIAGSSGALTASSFVLATTGHAFLNDKAAFSLASNTLPSGVVVTNPQTGATNIANPDAPGSFFNQSDFLLTASGNNPGNYTAAMTAYFAGTPGPVKPTFQPLDRHLIVGDGRVNENIGLTAVHEVFLNEHNRALTALKLQYGMPINQPLPPGGFDWTDPLTNVTTRITNEDLFQQAKIWVEMIYQHLTFDSFVRKLSPNIAAFAGVNPLINPQIFAEFAHAIYRLGHSMLPEEIGLRKFQDASSLSTITGQSVVSVALNNHGLKTGDTFVLSDVANAIGGIPIAALNGTFVVTVVDANTFTFDSTAPATATGPGLASDRVLLDLSRSLIDGFLNPTSYTPGATAGLLADGSTGQVGYRIDEKISDSLRDNLLGKPLDLATLNLMRGRDAGLPTLNELRGSIVAVAPLALQASLSPYTTWTGFRDNLKGSLEQQNATVKNFMMAYAADALFSQFGATGMTLGGVTGRSLEQWYALRASAVVAEQTQYMTALKAAAELGFADQTWMGTTGNKDFNRIDAWMGGLAEKEVVGGMLGSTFDAIFAMQMMNLQDGDFFYYLGRVPTTEFFIEGMEGTQISDLVMRNTTATNIYGDIFSVADSYVQVGDPNLPTAASLDALTELTTSQQVFDLAGNVITADVGTAGMINGVFTGNPTNYVDARNVLNPNGVGNASEMISGTAANDTINAGGGNDTVRAGAGADTINGGSGVDYLYGGDGNDTMNGDAENDFLYGNAGNDTMRGGIGVDVMFGHEGNDTMYGGADADIMIGGLGDDVMYGGDGITVQVAPDPALPAVTVPILDPEPAVAIALADDTMNGGDGNDTLYGGGGWDILSGESGHDTLIPGAGGAAQNLLGGREVMNGGEGDDIYIVENNLDFSSQDFNDRGLTTAQLINKGVGFRVGNGIGIDEVRFTQTTATDIVIGGTNVLGVPQTFSGVERVVLGTGLGTTADRSGTALINIDASLAISPGGAASSQGLQLLGNAAANIIVGSALDDVLDGGAGNDTLEGGLGDDTYVVSAAGDVLVEDPILGGGVDTVRVEFNGNYSLNNQAGQQLENLTLVGTNGTANINGTGNAQSNVIIGNAGNNVLSGLGGGDSLDGGAGNDTLIGGDGIDNLWGGLGSDTFTFNSAAEIGNNPLNRETIHDFDTATDILNFTFDANSALAGNQSFSFINQANFSAAGQLRFDNGVLYGNTDADLTTAEFALALSNVSNTAANNLNILPRTLMLMGPAQPAMEGSSNQVTFQTFTVMLSAPATVATTVNYTVSGTGVSPANAADFINGTFPQGSVTIPAGARSATFDVQIRGDATTEANETFLVTLTNNQPNTGANAALLVNASAIGTILDDELPGFSVSPLSINQPEGTAGTSTHTFTVTLSQALNAPASVNWQVNGTGPNPANAADFPGGVIPSGTLTFAPGEISKTISVTVAGDPTPETDETFLVALSGATAGTIVLNGQSNPSTIVNDDIPTLNLAMAPTINALALEGNAGQQNLGFQITSSSVVGTPITVNWAVQASGTNAANAADFFGGVIPSGTAVINPGSNTALFNVPINGDILLEPDETFNVVITSASMGQLGTAVVPMTLTNDDTATVSIAGPATISEGASGTFTVTLSSAASYPLSLPWTVVVNNPATATGADFPNATLPAGTVTIPAGQLTATFTVPVLADGISDPNEAFQVVLDGTNLPQGLSLGTASAQVAITNVDVTVVTLAVAPASVLENGATNLVYTFTRTGTTTAPLTVNYTVGGSATLGTDYTGIAATPLTKTVTIGANSATATVTVTPTGDTTVEADETVALSLAAGTGYALGTTTPVVGTITNDDLPVVTLAVAPASVTEDGATNLVYTFTRTGPTTNALTVNYTVDGTATNGTDYATIGTSVTFAAGSATATVTVNPTADTTVEVDETVALSLAAGAAYTVGTATAVVGTITNDDLPVITLAVDPASVTEDGVADLIYTFTRSGLTTNALTVNYTVGGTATNGTDYATIGTSVTFAAGSATATVTVNPTTDTTVEADETVALTLAAGAAYTVGTATAVVGTITNDDLPVVTLAVAAPAAVAEDGATNLAYTFTRTGPTTNALTVNVGFGGSANFGTDYTALGSVGTTISFAAGASTAQLAIDPIADTVIEPNETVLISLLAGAGYTVGTATEVVGTITNDDADATTAINGTAAANTLNGTAAAERITGFGGRDTISGGGAADTFVYTNVADSRSTGTVLAPVDGRDRISDFAAGTDKMDLSALGPLTFIGGAAFSAAGQVRSTAGTLQVNTVGTTGAEMEVLLTNNAVLTAADLILATAPAAVGVQTQQIQAVAPATVQEPVPQIQAPAPTPVQEPVPQPAALVPSTGATITGTNQANTLNGTANNDVITGLGGADTLNGLGGSDRFVYTAVADSRIIRAGRLSQDNRDRIGDFTSGTDTIDLSALGPLTFIGGATFSAAGQVRFSNGSLQVNTSGTSGSEMEILLTGVSTFAGSDLIL
jgi:Ca2+-binding RTX toxin-like protein